MCMSVSLCVYHIDLSFNFPFLLNNINDTYYTEWLY